MISLVLIILTLIFLLYMIYASNGRDYMSASFFMVCTFILSAFVSLLNILDWGVTVSLEAALIIISSVFVFSLGDILGQRWEIRTKVTSNRDARKMNRKDSIVIRWPVIIVASSFMTIVAYYYFQYIMRMSILAGNKYGMSKMFQYARYAINGVQYDSSMSTLLGHSIIISACLGYIFLFVIIFNILNHAHNKIGYYVPCLLYIVHIGLSTARLDFISYICAAIIFITLIQVKKSRLSGRIKFKTYIYLLIAIFVVFLGFRLLGYLTGKSSVREVWFDVSIYSGSSIPAFSYFIDNRPDPNQYFGQETLYNIYKILRKIGMTQVPAYSVALPFINIGNGFETNIYTAFRRLIQDYGIFLTQIIMFSEGFFYGLWTRKEKSIAWVGLGTIIYAYMFYPVMYTFFEEKFVLNFTAIRLLYHIFYFYVLYKLLIGRKINLRVK